MHKNNGICQLGIVPIRKNPSHRSEMVNQLLYGETYTFEKTEDKEWIRVITSHDNYSGYISSNQHFIVEKMYTSSTLITRSIFPDSPKFPNFLTAGSRISSEQKEVLGLKKDDFKEIESQVPDRQQMIKTAMSFLSSPYLWGGRTEFGIDCSGLSQMVYLLHGFNIPRDASQQIEKGENLTLSNVQDGDLAFFHNPEGKITHVGIVFYDENHRLKIIHASGKVRIDSLDGKGIFTGEDKIYSHNFHSLKTLL